mmetsp:Transcript_15176/g.22262  ORF Transcript_15176/g.22262 Transcript_15176/m.22262 type:complete len:93 (+) Transcript_15176:274-552(+)
MINQSTRSFVKKASSDQFKKKKAASSVCRLLCDARNMIICSYGVVGLILLLRGMIMISLSLSTSLSDLRIINEFLSHNKSWNKKASQCVLLR